MPTEPVINIAATTRTTFETPAPSPLEQLDQLLCDVAMWRVKDVADCADRLNTIRNNAAEIGLWDSDCENKAKEIARAAKDRQVQEKQLIIRDFRSQAKKEMLLMLIGATAVSILTTRYMWKSMSKDRKDDDGPGGAGTGSGSNASSTSNGASSEPPASSNSDSFAVSNICAGAAAGIFAAAGIAALTGVAAPASPALAGVGAVFLGLSALTAEKEKGSVPGA